MDHPIDRNQPPPQDVQLHLAGQTKLAEAQRAFTNFTENHPDSSNEESDIVFEIALDFYLGRGVIDNFKLTKQCLNTAKTMKNKTTIIIFDKIV